MTEIYICRHGQTQWNRQQILQGQLDSEITAQGRQQAVKLANLAQRWNINRLASSPLGRARQTASTVAQHLNINCTVVEQAQERGFGEWEGQPVNQLDQYQELLKNPLRWEYKTTVANGESGEQIRTRFTQGLEYLQQQFSGQRVLLISHGHIMEAVARQWQNTGILENGTGYRLLYQNEQWQWGNWLEQE